METGKIFTSKTPHLHQCDRQGIPHYHLYGRTACRRQVVQTSFLVDSCIEYDIRLSGEVRLQISDHPDQGIARAPDKRKKHLDLRAFPAFSKYHPHILLLHHSKIAVDGIGRVQEDGRSAGGIQGSDDLLRHDSAFPDAADHYAALTSRN